jgi:hypothetical protein
MKDTFLILASIGFLIVLGAATYEHIAVIPAWSAAPPASLSMFQGEYGLHAEYFWMAIHPLTLLLMIIALILNWNTLRRKNILTALIGYVIILLVTSIYFVPVLIGFIETPYQDSVDPALVKSASLWEMLSLVRLVFIVGIAYLLLSTLTKSCEVIVKSTPATVPLSYPNDSLGG